MIFLGVAGGVATGLVRAASCCEWVAAGVIVLGVAGGELVAVGGTVAGVAAGLGRAVNCCREAPSVSSPRG